jgi:hypothetical protein
VSGEQAGRDQGEAVLAQAIDAYAAAFGSRLTASYALGSLAHGGFSPLVSDVDLGLILRDPVRLRDHFTIRSVALSVRGGGSALHGRLSVFWGTPSTLAGQARGGRFRGGRFPPLDRLDLLEYGRLLAGADAREHVARPSRDELLVAGAEFALRNLGGGGDGPVRLRSGRDETLAEIRAPALLASRGARRVTKVVLFPVRFLFTAATGQVGTNALAAEHYLAGAGAPGAELVGAAMGWREAWPGPEEAVALLGRDLVPLYAHYLEDHITRLQGIGRERLASSFRRWRGRLLA